MKDVFMKRIRDGLSVLLVLFGVVLAIEPVNPDLSPEGRELLTYFESIYGTKTVYGYNVYVHTPDVYEQTGKHGAIFAKDLEWFGNTQNVIDQIRAIGCILTIHWHWSYDEQSAWTGKRQTPVDVGKVVTPGTAEYERAVMEIDTMAARLKLIEAANIPVLFRPLHEIDGGWFWWTDSQTPENTARLWQLMYDRLTNHHHINNLIWVYSAGVGSLSKKPVAYRKRFYPGAAYVDISGIDIYGVDPQNDVDKYNEYFNTMSQVSPGKMLAMGEGDAVPDPDKMQRGDIPTWLWVLPWWGTPNRKHPFDWAVHTMRHDYVVTLDELPKLGSVNTPPHIGIVEPLDDGTGWFDGMAPVFKGYGVDRDGHISKMSFYANDTRIGELFSAPYTFTWDDAPAGCYDIHAVAVDNDGAETKSNTVRIAVNMNDLARGKPVVTSSGDDGSEAVDGDYHTNWSPEKSDSEWIYIDLGGTHTIKLVNLYWGWKIHAKAFTVDVALDNPGSASSWTTVHSETNREYVTWEARDRIAFNPVEARYVRMQASDRTQDWGGYSLTAFEVPVESGATAMTNGKRPLEMSIYQDTPGMQIFTVSGRTIGTVDARCCVSKALKNHAHGLYLLRYDDTKSPRGHNRVIVNTY
ncbi:MAG: hypothetical protein GF350_13440 [Chitinivibrionales bacterium]|nr:hypothetical protein [Chitinivibrionales bacterium]